MSEIVVQPRTKSNPAPGSSPVPLADCSREEHAERRYLAVLDPLVAEAARQDSLETLVDVLVWTLARVSVGLENPYVAGDVLRRLGNYTCRLVDAKRAEAEAGEAKKQGIAPH